MIVNRFNIWWNQVKEKQQWSSEHFHAHSVKGTGTELNRCVALRKPVVGYANQRKRLQFAG